MKAGVLLVAAESPASHALEKLLSEQGYDVVFVHETQAALRALEGSHPDALVTEASTSRIDGMALLKRARALRPDVCAVLVAEDGRSLDEALKQGAADLQFPAVHPPKLLSVLERGLAAQGALRRIGALETRLDERYGFESFAGHGTAATQVIRQARRAAEGDDLVVLVGEPGTGKATLAQAIHQNSRRGRAPFVRASALTEEALAAARGGTIYLEDIAALMPAPEGIRILAGARTDSKQHATITIPPLRERIEDVPLLVEEFLKEFNRTHGRRITGVTRGALEQLSTYEWPGNVRELRDAIEGMVVFAEARRPLDVSDLPHAVRIADRPGREAITLPLNVSLAEVEKRFIEETLLAVRYDRPRAAAALGIGLRTLYRKLKEYEIG